MIVVVRSCGPSAAIVKRTVFWTVAPGAMLPSESGNCVPSATVSPGGGATASVTSPEGASPVLFAVKTMSTGSFTLTSAAEAAQRHSSATLRHVFETISVLGHSRPWNAPFAVKRTRFVPGSPLVLRRVKVALPSGPETAVSRRLPPSNAASGPSRTSASTVVPASPAPSDALCTFTVNGCAASGRRFVALSGNFTA